MTLSPDPHAQEVLLSRYRLLIHHVLHGFHLEVHDQNYDDYFQDLYLELVALAERFDGDPLSDRDRYRFVGYAQRGLRWHLTLLLKRSARLNSRLIGDRKVTWLADHRPQPSVLGEGDSTTLATALDQALTPADRYFLTIASQPDLALHDKLTLLGISKNTYYTRLKHLRHKLQRCGWSA